MSALSSGSGSTTLSKKPSTATCTGARNALCVAYSLQICACTHAAHRCHRAMNQTMPQPGAIVPAWRAPHPASDGVPQ